MLLKSNHLTYFSLLLFSASWTPENCVKLVQIHSKINCNKEFLACKFSSLNIQRLNHVDLSELAKKFSGVHICSTAGGGGCNWQNHSCTVFFLALFFNICIPFFSETVSIREIMCWNINEKWIQTEELQRVNDNTLISSDKTAYFLLGLCISRRYRAQQPVCFLWNATIWILRLGNSGNTT